LPAELKIDNMLDSAPPEQQPPERTSVLLSATSVAAGIIQGACAILVASSTAKIFLGIAGLAAAVKTSELHADIVRIPMMLVSTILSLITLFVLWNAHRLRNLPSARWRKRPLTTRQKLGIAFSLGASVLTLVLVVAEITIHPLFSH
jgi:hypothetical protein